MKRVVVVVAVLAALFVSVTAQNNAARDALVGAVSYALWCIGMNQLESVVEPTIDASPETCTPSAGHEECAGPLPEKRSATAVPTALPPDDASVPRPTLRPTDPPEPEPETGGWFSLPSWLGGGGGADEPSEQTDSSSWFPDVFFGWWPSGPVEEQEELATPTRPYEQGSQRRHRRASMTQSEALQHPTVVESWDKTQELLADVEAARQECQKASGETIRMARPPNVEELEDLAPKEQVDVLHYGVCKDPVSLGDYMNRDNYCVHYAEKGIYLQAAAEGYINAETAATLGDGHLLMNALPFRMDVSRDGKRLYPYGELRRLCGSVKNRNKVMTVWKAFLTQYVVTLGKYRVLIGADDAIVVGWGVPGSKFAKSLDDVDGAELCINQPVSRVRGDDAAVLAEPIGERPRRHAVVLTSRRWRGGRGRAARI